MVRLDPSASTASSMTTTTATSALDVSLTEQDTSRSNGGAQDSAMRVYVRIRPFTASELLENGERPNRTIALDARDGHIKIMDPSRNFTTRLTYVFERCFDSAEAGPGADQEEVYTHVGRTVLNNTVDGYNGCILAYGQTGTGKTYTMLGPRDVVTSGRFYREELAQQSSSFSSITKLKLCSPSPSCSGQMKGIDESAFLELSLGGDSFSTTEEGIIPRLARDLFNSLRQKQREDSSYSYRVEMEFYEIYNEKVFDLISGGHSTNDLRVRHQTVRGVFVEGLDRKPIAAEEDLLFWMYRGSIERHTASTKMNDRSSRSHAILSIHVVQMTLDENNNTNRVSSKLNLVDLAGSERIGASGVEGLHFKESTKINLSLTALGRVIDCLADASTGKPSAFCPYRESNLTWLLMDSLGGNSKTSMVATVSPCVEHYEVTCQTLRYASRAKQIVNVAVVNEDPQVRQIKKLTAEVSRLKQLLNNQSICDYSNEEVERLRQRVVQLQQEAVERDFMLETFREELNDKTSLMNHHRNGSVTLCKHNANGKQHQQGGETMTKDEVNSPHLMRRTKGKESTGGAATGDYGGKQSSRSVNPYLNARTLQQLKYLRIEADQDYGTLIATLARCAFDATMNYECTLQKNIMMINSHSHALRENVQKMEAKEWLVLASIGDGLLSEFAKACGKHASTPRHHETVKPKGLKTPEVEVQDKDRYKARMEINRLRERLYDAMVENDGLKERCEALEKEAHNFSKMERTLKQKLATLQAELDGAGPKVIAWATNTMKAEPGLTPRTAVNTTRENHDCPKEGRRMSPLLPSARCVQARKVKHSPRQKEVGATRRVAEKNGTEAQLENSVCSLSVPVLNLRQISAAAFLRSAIDSHHDALLDLLMDKFRLVGNLYEQYAKSFLGKNPLTGSNGKSECPEKELTLAEERLPSKKVPKRSVEVQKKSKVASDMISSRGRGRGGVLTGDDALCRESTVTLHSPRGAENAKGLQRRCHQKAQATTVRKTSRRTLGSSSDIFLPDCEEEVTFLKEQFTRRESEIKKEHQSVVRELQNNLAEAVKRAAQEYKQLLDQSSNEKKQLNEQLAKYGSIAAAAEKTKESVSEQTRLFREQCSGRTAIEIEQMEVWASTVASSVASIYRLRKEQESVAAAKERQQLINQAACDKAELTCSLRHRTEVLLEWVSGREVLLCEEERTRAHLVLRFREQGIASGCCAELSTMLVESHKLLTEHCVVEHQVFIEGVTPICNAFLGASNALAKEKSHVMQLQGQVRSAVMGQCRQQLLQCREDEISAREAILASQDSEAAVIKDALRRIGGAIVINQKFVTDLRNRLNTAQTEQHRHQLRGCLEYEANSRNTILAAQKDGVATIRFAFEQAHLALEQKQYQTTRLNAELDCSKNNNHLQGVRVCLDSETDARDHLVAYQQGEWQVLESCFNTGRKMLMDNARYLCGLLDTANTSLAAAVVRAPKSALGAVFLFEQHERFVLEELNAHTTCLQDAHRELSVLLSTSQVQRECDVTLTALENYYSEELARTEKENKELKANIQILRENLDFQASLDQLQAEIEGDGPAGLGSGGGSEGDPLSLTQHREGLGISGLISNFFTRVGYVRKDGLPRDFSPRMMMSHASSEEDFGVMSDAAARFGYTPVKDGRNRRNSMQSIVGSALFPPNHDSTPLRDDDASIQ
ncbi:kinesin, putative [Trypanosoma brucei gambiense DAL972]|uniref:Kinesin, putative n=1 Tax=Trypanosoma brucei gambiense (strain MHOM/CI/86/DAL972) TaxID=679716 RepID=D0A0M0_TRYB9|nr:kinesin, putative [Trypanosoma brucei gambiense DAL972]CBH16778.1 kinesin, putative [Trypanosoma brucei gambiense DAL972]|eukprot:XP_011779042.1 kinesin, putative [Trypanosoma brucei gambiense DAL972]